MRLQQLQNNYLYEGLDRESINTAMLWESAGFKLKEAALTADQIQQIFQSVEQGATDAGGNRTLLGKGKDAAEAVNKAWEDLKTKIQNSKPIANVDAAYDSAVAKIEAGLGGPDNAISKIIMAYRKFAKEHPVAQGFIYSALIAAAGISSAGLGGAAVLGLLKMADKLLQGEKFSSAAYSGAKTGAMAYGASKIGDYLKGKPEGDVPDAGAAADAAAGAAPAPNTKALADLATDPNLSPIQQKLAADLAAGKNVQGADEFIRKAIEGAAKRQEMLGNNPDGSAGAALRQFMSLQRLQAATMGESIQWTGRKLSEGQVYMIFNRVSREQLTEGPLDAIKGAAGKAAGWLATKGKNLTTKVTADKLNSAWQKAGSPMDSDQVAAILQAQGVDKGIVDKVYADLKLPAAADPAAKKEPTLDQPAKATSQYMQTKDQILKLNKKERQRLMAQLQKELGTA